MPSPNDKHESPHVASIPMHEIMDCQDAGTALNPYQATAWEHIQGCERCREFFHTFRQMRDEGWTAMPPEEIIPRLDPDRLAPRQ